MCAPGQIIHDLDRSVASCHELVKLSGTKLPELGPSKVIIIDAVNNNFGLRMGKVEFLTNRIVLVYQLGSLDLYIHLVTIQLAGDCISQMFKTSHPWQGIPTKCQIW